MKTQTVDIKTMAFVGTTERFRLNQVNLLVHLLVDTTVRSFLQSFLLSLSRLFFIKEVFLIVGI